MLASHYAVFKSWLEGDAFLTGKVDTSIRLTSGGEAVKANYVVAFPSVPDDLNDNRYTAAQRAESAGTFTYDVRCVAVDATGCLLYADKVIGRLLGHRLDVTGRDCDPVTLVAGVEEGRVEFDRTVRIFYIDLSFRFRSYEEAT